LIFKDFFFEKKLEKRLTFVVRTSILYVLIGRNVMNSKKFAELMGWIGMVLIHGATLPVTLGVILGYTDSLPPMSMVLLVWSGLFLFLIRAVAQKDMLYIVSNAVGFFFQSILLALIVF
jgi:hypothetical protein